MSEEEIINKIDEIVEYSKLCTDIGFAEQTEKIEVIQGLLDLYNKEKEKNKELEKENLEIRDWKYVIDCYEDLDRLKELDLIKIKGKEYISKNMYDELEKDKKALVKNYSTILGSFISKDNLKKIIYPTPENPISLEMQSSEMYKRLKKLLEN